MKDRATEYAKAVVAGLVVAGKPHIQACQRHLKDLKRQGTPDFPYVWRPGMSNRILEYAETLTIAEGTEPRPVVLMDFQWFDLGVPFGWYKKNGSRRFRRSYKSMARQNGKTFQKRYHRHICGRVRRISSRKALYCCHKKASGKDSLGRNGKVYSG